MKFEDVFTKLANKSSSWMGKPWAFLGALTLVVIWAGSGPFFDYSDTWELIINTATTIITFLMVFLIQNTQNRDAQAIHMKLDELIFSLKTADNSLISAQNLSSDKLEQLAKHYEEMSKQACSLSKKEK